MGKSEDLERKAWFLGRVAAQKCALLIVEKEMLKTLSAAS
jgi:hypothetical protein